MAVAVVVSFCIINVVTKPSLIFLRLYRTSMVIFRYFQELWREEEAAGQRPKSGEGGRRRAGW